jgi:hypothetical protein
MQQQTAGQERYERMIATAATILPTDSAECHAIQEAIQEIIDNFDDPLPPRVAARLRALEARARALHCRIILQ